MSNTARRTSNPRFLFSFSFFLSRYPALAVAVSSMECRSSKGFGNSSTWAILECQVVNAERGLSFG